MIKKILYDNLNRVCIGNYYITDEEVVESSVSFKIYKKVIEEGSMNLGEYTILFYKETNMFLFTNELYMLSFEAKSSMRFFQIFQKLFSVLEVH